MNLKLIEQDIREFLSKQGVEVRKLEFHPEMVPETRKYSEYEAVPYGCYRESAYVIITIFVGGKEYGIGVLSDVIDDSGLIHGLLWEVVNKANELKEGS